MSASRTVRFGIMCDDLSFEAWQAACLRSLLSLDFVEASLLVIDAESRDEGVLSKVRRIGASRLLRPLVTEVLLRPRCYQKIDLSDELGGLDRVVPEVERRGQDSQYFDEKSVEAIRSYDLDFLLRFSFGILRGEILEAARHGVWSFHHQDERKYRGGTPGFWEILRGDPVSGAMLQRLTERLDSGIILRRGRFRTRGHSFYENLNNLHFGTAHWPSAVCHDIRNGHMERLSGSPSETEAPVYPQPTNSQTIALFGMTLLNLFREIIRALFRHERWSIGFVDCSIDEVMELEQPLEVSWLPEITGGRYLADPFGLRDDDQTIVLCEDFRCAGDRGIVSGFRLEPDRQKALEVEPVIDEFSHASYPFVFQHDSRWFCVPETHRERAVFLFVAETPWKWRKVDRLIDGVAAADPTIFRAERLWWLAYTDVERARYRDLFLWYASELTGPWRPHEQNPVKTDICGARPAGTPFWKDGALHRPAQDCSQDYGKQVVIHRIERLTPTRFSEVPVTTISPDPEGRYPAGLHTIAASGPITLVDGKRYVFEPAMLRHRAVFIARKMLGQS